jgi:hypothetical protein
VIDFFSLSCVLSVTADMMKKILPAALVFLSLLALASCQTNGDGPEGAASAKDTAVTLCEFSETDSATTLSRLPGKWVLRGVQTNYMGSQQDELLTGEQMGAPKSLTFFENGEYEEHVDGKLQGERQAYKLVGQSLTPVGYQFWFCDENTLVVSNIIADGVTEVYVKE